MTPDQRVGQRRIAAAIAQGQVYSSKRWRVQTIRMTMDEARRYAKVTGQQFLRDLRRFMVNGVPDMYYYLNGPRLPVQSSNQPAAEMMRDHRDRIIAGLVGLGKTQSVKAQQAEQDARAAAALGLTPEGYHTLLYGDPTVTPLEFPGLLSQLRDYAGNLSPVELRRARPPVVDDQEMVRDFFRWHDSLYGRAEGTPDAQD